MTSHHLFRPSLNNIIISLGTMEIAFSETIEILVMLSNPNINNYLTVYQNKHKNIFWSLSENANTCHFKNSFSNMV